MHLPRGVPKAEVLRLFNEVGVADLHVEDGELQVTFRDGQTLRVDSAVATLDCHPDHECDEVVFYLSLNGEMIDIV